MSEKDTHENENSDLNDETVDETTGESEEDTQEESENEESNEETSEEEESNDSDDSDEEDEDSSDTDYRPKEPKKEEFVPLKKYTKLRKELQKLRKQSSESDSSLQTEDLEELADKYKLPEKFVKDLATTIETRSLKKAEEKIAPLIAKQTMSENERLFNADFDKTILTKYPHLADKKEHFKKIAFSPDFVHLKSLEDIRKEFFDSPPPKKKTESIEGGSSGAERTGDEDINLDNPTEQQLEKILDNPALRKKYFERQDALGL